MKKLIHEYRFLIIGLLIPYIFIISSIFIKVNKDLTAYVTVSNLTNEAYENTALYNYGPGAAPQPGRCIMVGMKYTF